MWCFSTSMAKFSWGSGQQLRHRMSLDRITFRHVFFVQSLLLPKLALHNPPKSWRWNLPWIGWNTNQMKPPSIHTNFPKHYNLFPAETISNLALGSWSHRHLLFTNLRGEIPMAGDTWQILHRHLLHLLVAQALEGWQFVLGADIFSRAANVWENRGLHVV